MPRDLGARLGPYEIVEALGAGGMGEVYRARDLRLGRDVALKVLHSAIAADPAAVSRFEQESRAVGRINHPNILAVYDVGTHEGIAYLVTELLVGRSLRAVVSGGSLTRGKALDYAVQIARGLAAAHQKSIVHRDLKPENVFVTDSGHVKLLDFGLAKLTPAPADEGTLTRLTSAGVVMGTVGYMSPEQVRGEEADERSDIFSFGTVLYELLGGTPPFHAPTAAESIAMVLREDPAPLSNVPAPLAGVVQRCLEKNPGDRLQSAHDLALTLETLRGATTEATVLAPVATTRRTWMIPALVAVASFLVALFVWAPWRPVAYQLDFQQLTFRRGAIRSARFVPGGQEVVYSASWAGEPNQIYVVRPGSPDWRSLGLQDVNLFGVSSAGELAISIGCTDFFIADCGGTLARVPFAGGTPKPLLDAVRSADWLPGGQELAVVRHAAGRSRVEFPAGKAIYESAGWISSLRVAPQGDAVVFADHPMFGDYGTVTMVSREGRASVLTKLWNSLEGVAWAPDGQEIWFAAAEEKHGFADHLHVVTRAGRERTVLRLPGTIRLFDVGPGGRVLLTRESFPTQLIFRGPNDTERDLAWLDGAILPHLSDDGQWIAFSEAGNGAGTNPAVFVRKTDGSPATRIVTGFIRALSPDARWVLALDPAQTVLTLAPTGAGEAMTLSLPGFEQIGSADFTPDRKTVVFLGRQRGEPWKLYAKTIPDGRPRAIGGAGGFDESRFEGELLSPDGQEAWVRDPDGHVSLVGINDGSTRPAKGVGAADGWVAWADDRSAYVRPAGGLGRRVVRVDLSSGAQQPVLEWTPADPTGLLANNQMVVTPDGRSSVVWISRAFSDLYLAETQKVP